MTRDRQRPRLALHLAQLFERERGPVGGRAGFEHAEKAVILGDVVDDEAEQKAVVERQQLVILRQLVARAEQREERHSNDFFPVVKEPLVDEREYRVENRRVRFEDLVEKRDVRLGKLPRSDAPVIVLLESAEAHGAENLLRRREAREQPLKITRAF